MCCACISVQNRITTMPIQFAEIMSACSKYKMYHAAKKTDCLVEQKQPKTARTQEVFCDQGVNSMSHVILKLAPNLCKNLCFTGKCSIGRRGLKYTK